MVKPLSKPFKVLQRGISFELAEWRNRFVNIVGEFGDFGTVKSH